jgi:hypothetical protein
MAACLADEQKTIREMVVKARLTTIASPLGTPAREIKSERGCAGNITSRRAAIFAIAQPLSTLLGIRRERSSTSVTIYRLKAMKVQQILDLAGFFI